MLSHQLIRPLLWCPMLAHHPALLGTSLRCVAAALLSGNPCAAASICNEAMASILFSAHQALFCCIHTCSGQLTEHVMPYHFEDPLRTAAAVAQTAVSPQFLHCCRR